MSYSYNLEEGKNWMFSYMKPLFDIPKNIGFDEFSQKITEISIKANEEVFLCLNDLKNQGVFGCQFKSQEDVEKYCNNKDDCIGYLKGFDALNGFDGLKDVDIIKVFDGFKGFDTLKKTNTYIYIPTKKLPIKNENENLKTEFGEISFYKKKENKENKDKIFGIDKNTFYIILFIILIILIIIGYMFYK